MSFYLLEDDKYMSLKNSGDLIIRTINPSEFKLNDYITFIKKHNKNVSPEFVKAKVMNISKSDSYYDVLFKI